MAISVVTTNTFEKDLKAISKKHKSILFDIIRLSNELRENPRMGTNLGNDFYKIRMAISGTNNGKSGGARVITCVVHVTETIYLSRIYLKSEHENVEVSDVFKSLKDEGLL